MPAELYPLPGKYWSVSSWYSSKAAKSHRTLSDKQDASLAFFPLFFHLVVSWPQRQRGDEQQQGAAGGGTVRTRRARTSAGWSQVTQQRAAASRLLRAAHRARSTGAVAPDPSRAYHKLALQCFMTDSLEMSRQENGTGNPCRVRVFQCREKRTATRNCWLFLLFDIIRVGWVGKKPLRTRT